MMQLQMTPKPLSDVAYGCPRYVSSIVDKAIAKDRELRYPNIAALARELRAARKRFVAENQFEGAGVPAAGEGLREKFGAPPREAPHPAPAIRDAAPDTAADVPLAQANEFPTEVQAPREFTQDGSTPPPGYVPTVLLSSSSVPGFPPELGALSDATDRGLPPDEVRSRTTQTNPIGFVRAANAFQDDSLEIDFREGSWIAFWRHPFVRRAAVTLGLGAVIGVPPAVLGVLWARYYRPPASAPAVSLPARPLAPAPSGLVPLAGAGPSTVSEPRADPTGVTVSPASQGAPKPAAASSAKATPRARPKSPSAATATARSCRRWFSPIAGDRARGTAAGR